MPSRPPAHPVQTLREHATALEAAITLALANPKREPVHRLRTSTRRIEAQLELLSLLPDLPDHRKSAQRVRKLVKHLRRAAGDVRDLDVQRSLVKHHSDRTASRHLRRDARELRRSLKTDRSAEADKLVKLLAEEQQKLAPALEKLLDDLEPAANIELSSTRLTQLVQQWYQQNTPPLKKADSNSLHAVRKSAKLARYIAASGAPAIAHHFESLQEAGGSWHDLLTLVDTSQRYVGKKSRLTQHLRQQQAEALHSYLELLQKQNGQAPAQGSPA